MSGRRVLPADVYDALEIGAMAAGGIGAYRAFHNGLPCCIHGIALFVGNPDPSRDCLWSPEDHGADYIKRILFDQGIDGSSNDVAVRDICIRNSWKPESARVSFAAWCAELGVVRGGA